MVRRANFSDCATISALSKKTSKKAFEAEQTLRAEKSWLRTSTFLLTAASNECDIGLLKS